MTHGESLLRAILEDPSSDAARLVYADWLEENGETARAEFIRVQVGLAKKDLLCWRDAGRSDLCWSCWIIVTGKESLHRDAVKKFSCQCTGTVFRLYHRERESWDRVTSQFWFDWDHAPGRLGQPHLTHMRRGFVARVELTTADFLTHAADLFAAQPITEVRLTDRHPAEESTGWVRWHGSDGENLRFPDRLPMVVYDRLTGEHLRYDYRPDFDPNVYYPSAAEAHAALSRACVAYSRDLVGLPPLEPTTPALPLSDAIGH